MTPYPDFERLRAVLAGGRLDRVPLAEVKPHRSGKVFAEARMTIDPPNEQAARFDLAPPLFLDDLAAVPDALASLL